MRCKQVALYLIILPILIAYLYTGELCSIYQVQSDFLEENTQPLKPSSEGVDREVSPYREVVLG